MADSFIARGGGWVAGQSLLMLSVAVLGVLFRRSCPCASGVEIGIALCLLGAAFGIAGALVLGRSRTMFPKPRENATLVRHGIYARVRHPLYTSVMLLSLGWGVIWESWPACIAALSAEHHRYCLRGEGMCRLPKYIRNLWVMIFIVNSMA